MNDEKNETYVETKFVEDLCDTARFYRDSFGIAQ